MRLRVLQLILGVCIAVLAAPRFAAGQGPGSPVPGVQATGDLALTIESVGMGGRARPGSWTPVLVGLAESGTSGREILLRLEARDPDGDLVLWERAVTSSPGTKLTAWLYMLMPTSTNALSVELAAYEAVESGTAFRAGELLARVFVPTTERELAAPSEELIAVIGNRTAGLGRLATSSMDDPAVDPVGHSATELVAQLEPADVPDRWWGLDAFGTIVWTGGQPQDLRSASAAAIREWVRRGGHLVVVLPALGQQWSSELNNGLYELLPDADIVQRTQVPYAPMRTLLTKSETVRLPGAGVVHSFEPRASAGPGSAVRVLDDPGGSCVVIRRHVGAGAVTMIGLDLTMGALRGEGLPEADVFWNRVLGLRGRAVTQDELAKLQQDNAYSFYRPSGSSSYDSDIGRQIAQEGRASVGVLLGFVVFVLYWLVAGPLGFALLKGTGRSRHAWVGFVSSTALFTLIAWIGAVVIRPSEVGGTHLTVLTHVYGQQTQSGRSWFGLLLPEYGNARVTLDRGVSAERSDVLGPWSGADASASVRFPDPRSYAIESRSPSSMSVPTRQTVKQFRGDFAGLTPWGLMPRPVTAADGSASRIRIETIGGVRQLTGRVTHALPGPLLNTTVIFNPGQKNLGRLLPENGAERLISDAFAGRLVDPWEPGVELDLAEVTGRDARREGGGQFESLLDQQTIRSSSALATATETNAVSRYSLNDRLLGLLFYHHLQPPQLRRSQQPTQAVVTRGETHGLELSRWLTEPCLIIVGLVDQTAEPADPPMPLEVDGVTPKMQGQTLVAWVYPLTQQPPAWSAGGEEPGPAGGTP